MTHFCYEFSVAENNSEFQVLELLIYAPFVGSIVFVFIGEGKVDSGNLKHSESFDDFHLLTLLFAITTI